MVQKKVKKRKKMTPFNKVLCAVLIVASGFMLWAAVQEAMTTLKLQQQLSDVQAKLQEVQDENNYLNSEKEKLQDPDNSRKSSILKKGGKKHEDEN